MRKEFTKLEVIETCLIAIMIVFVFYSIILNKESYITIEKETKTYTPQFILNDYTSEDLSSILDDMYSRLGIVDDDLATQVGRDTTINNSLTALTNKSNTNNVFLKAYPVGSIYISYSGTNPGTIFGGTWEAFGTGRTLAGINTSDTDFASVGKTGGANSISYTPAGSINNTTLTVANLPAHTHGSKSLTGTFYIRRYEDNGSGDATKGIVIVGAGGTMSVNTTSRWSGTHGTMDKDYNNASSPTIDAVTINATHEHSSVGGGGAHNHSFTGTAASIDVLQPYVTVYMWKRTA